MAQRTSPSARAPALLGAPRRASRGVTVRAPRLGPILRPAVRGTGQSVVRRVGRRRRAPRAAGRGGRALRLVAVWRPGLAPPGRRPWVSRHPCAALTLGEPGDFEVTCATAVATSLGMEHTVRPDAVDRYPQYAELQVTWEHVANGLSSVYTWGVPRHLGALGH